MLSLPGARLGTLSMQRRLGYER